VRPGEDDEEEEERDEPVVLPIEDTIDLHTFAPREVGDVVREWLDACAGRFASVRIIHGKGIGNLRRTVHAVLDRHPAVASYALAGDASGWGATVVKLKAQTP
jgi:dsDNA-specific endonuclease/ATPase MutS2